MFSPMYGLVTAHFVRGHLFLSLNVVLRKSGLTGLVNCTRNIEKSVKNRVTLRPNISRILDGYRKSDLIFRKFSLFSIKVFVYSKFDLGTPSWVKTGSKFLGLRVTQRCNDFSA